MDLSEHTERAIDACYDAIFDPDLWSSALHHLAHSLGASGCLFHPHDPDSALSHLPVSPGLAVLADLSSRTRDYAPNPYEVRAGPLVKAGYAALAEEQISTADERRTSAYYQEVAQP